MENNNKGKIDKMKKGLELFKIRENNSLPNFSALEENGIHLPPLYKLFFKYYQNGTFYSFYNFQNLNNEPFNFLTTIINKHKDIPIFDTLLDEYGIIKNIHFCEGLDFIPIGYFGSEMMLIGSIRENQDIIYKHRFNDRNNMDVPFLKIADSFFELISYFEEIESDLVTIENRNKLYRNWGEDFWRIREDEK